MHVMATILITKFTKEKVLYTQKVLSTSRQFCVAAETKTRCHFLFVACIPHPWGRKKKQWGINLQKSWVVHVLLSAARLLDLALVVSIQLGSAWLPSGLLLPVLCQPPRHSCASHMPLQCLGSCSRTREPAMAEIPASALCICTSLYWRGTTVSWYNLEQIVDILTIWTHHCSGSDGLCRSNYGSSMFYTLYGYERCFTFYD